MAVRLAPYKYSYLLTYLLKPHLDSSSLYKVPEQDDWDRISEGTGTLLTITLPLY